MESLKHTLDAAKGAVKPWGPWLDRNAYERPENAGEALTRARRNAETFRVNYALVVTGCAALTLATNPRALLTFAVVALVAARALASDLSVAGRKLSAAERSALVGACAFVALFVLTDAGAVLLSGLCLGGLGACAHAATYTYEELFSIS